MVSAGIERVVSVSSEDPEHPAQNLIAGSLGSTDVKWKSKSPGERQVTVVLQLTQSNRINRIEVQNENSAFLEVLVGRSCMPDDFKTILVSSCLMTVKDAKFGGNPNAVRVFEAEDLCSDVASEKWDRVKVSCTQPFNSTVTYGLCFIRFHVEPSDQTHESVTLSNSSNSFQPNRITKDGDASRCQRENESPTSGLSGAVAARRATNSLGGIKLPSASRFKAKVQDVRSSVFNGVTDGPNGSANFINFSAKESEMKRGEVLGSGSRAEPSHNLPKDVGPSSSDHLLLATDSTKNPCKPFHRLLEGVIFSVSGYQNPLRSDLRRKALEMGAKYKADWDVTCTHLICAFMNTPKYREVRGRGKIVTKEWIEECYSKRKALHWRRFALAAIDKARPDSDEEIDEEVAPIIDHRKTLIDSESDSTDEEFKELKKRKKVRM